MNKEKPPVLGIPIGSKAQRDADVAYYEPIIQQANAEVAREIFEEIEAECSHLISHDMEHWVSIQPTKRFCKQCWKSLKDRISVGGKLK